jgi:uncharacterized protein
MRSQASSFHADAASPRWYRERWPWFLMAGPLAAVVASLASAWIAVKSDDGLVAQDYYKQGLLINQKLARTPAVEPTPGASISVDPDLGVRVHLYGAAQAPSRLLLTLARPSEHGQSRRVNLALDDDGEWVGTMPELAPGRWIISLGSETWQLPVTTVIGPFTEITLGAMHGHS